MKTTAVVTFKEPAKLFLDWLIECMGQEAWVRRREKIKSSISNVENNIVIGADPIEWQLFKPPVADKIGWYMFLVDVLGTEKATDDPFESHRIYPIFAAIGDQLGSLKLVPNVSGVIARLISSKHNQPDNYLFELLVASHYLRNGYDVSYIKDQPAMQTPDLEVSKLGVTIFVECKRLEKITAYAEKENRAWDVLWKDLALEMLKGGDSYWIDVTFKVPPSKVSADRLIEGYKNLAENFIGDIAHYNSDEFDAELHLVGSRVVNKHFSKYSVRANSPQVHALIFGDVNPNEKRSVACIPTDVARPGLPGAVLNIFLEGIERCSGAQWRCTSSESLDKRSKHFKTIINEAVSQIPIGSLGIIHTFYETAEGVEIEIKRREKLIAALTGFQVEDRTLLAALVHGVNIYPGIEGFEWAETVQHFSIMPDITDELFEHVLLLGFTRKDAIKDETHWEQDVLTEKQRKGNQPKMDA